MFFALAFLAVLTYLFAFDPTSFAETAGPIAVALIAFLASFKIDLHGSRIRSAIGLLASIYAAGAPFLGIMPNGWARVALFVGGILTTSLSERLQGGVSTQGLVALLCTGALIFTMACNAPSRATIERLHNASVIVVNEIDLNAGVLDELLAEKVIDPGQYALAKEVVVQFRSGASSVEAGLAVALTSEHPNLAQLAPIVAETIGKLRSLRALNIERLQKFLAAAEIGLRVLGSYFAMQVAEARDAGLSDRQICQRANMAYDETKFKLLASAYDGRKFEEYALAAGV